ncbi:MAG: metallophosphoesterase [Clostridiaceae bacterium]
MSLLLAAAGSAVALGAFLYSQNNYLKVSTYEYSSTRLPKAMKGTRIVQLSDLHSKVFPNNTLINTVKNLKPHLIVFTGDLIDSRNYEEVNSLNTMEQLCKIAPVYFSPGNHENRREEFTASLEPKLKKAGVRILRNDGQLFIRNGVAIKILGVDDPLKESQSYDEILIDEGYIKGYIKEAQSRLVNNPAASHSVGMSGQGFTLLLSHRPEHLKAYAEADMDLVFSGHTHGGQMRIPFANQGLFAPNQGVLPKYTEGRHVRGNTTLFISRGLGNSSFPFRVFNRPEIIAVDLV